MTGRPPRRPDSAQLSDTSLAERAQKLRSEGYSYTLIQRELGIPYLEARELAASYDARHGKPKRVVRKLPEHPSDDRPIPIPVRELRNHSARILRQVEKGQRFLVTVTGRTVAELNPVQTRPYFVPRHVVERIIREAPLDPGFFDDIKDLRDQRVDEV
jgi:prevent-host-death family protein